MLPVFRVRNGEIAVAHPMSIGPELAALDIALQYLMNGLMLGVMYALVAVGLPLFFGVLGVIKFSPRGGLTGGGFPGPATPLPFRGAQASSAVLPLLARSVVGMAGVSARAAAR